MIDRKTALICASLVALMFAAAFWRITSPEEWPAQMAWARTLPPSVVLFMFPAFGALLTGTLYWKSFRPSADDPRFVPWQRWGKRFAINICAALPIGARRLHRAKPWSSRASSDRPNPGRPDHDRGAAQDQPDSETAVVRAPVHAGRRARSGLRAEIHANHVKDPGRVRDRAVRRGVHFPIRGAGNARPALGDPHHFRCDRAVPDAVLAVEHRLADSSRPQIEARAGGAWVSPCAPPCHVGSAMV